MGTAIVVISLTGLVILVLRKIRKNKRSGKSASCFMDCSKCNGTCQFREFDQKERNE